MFFSKSSTLILPNELSESTKANTVAVARQCESAHPFSPFEGLRCGARQRLKTHNNWSKVAQITAMPLKSWQTLSSF